MLDPQKIQNSKYIAMLPESKEGWQLASFNDMIFAVSPGHAPLVLHEDGWKEIEFTEADFQTEAGKEFQAGIQQAARMKMRDNHRKKAVKFVAPNSRAARRLAKKKKS